LAVNKLNIEFEDDEEIRAREEAKRKKSEALGDVDLAFGEDDDSASASAKRKALSRQREGARPSSSGQPQQPQGQQRRPEAPQQSRSAPPQSSQQGDFQQLPTRQVYIGPEYKLGDELKKIAASNQVLAIEIEARVKVEVTQQLSTMIAEHHAKNKLLEHKINKLLTSIHQKAPATKGELMAIKKLLKEQASLTSEVEGEATQGSNGSSVKDASSAIAKKKAA